MNAAVRAVTRATIRKGMQVYGIRRGYNGLINGDVFEMNERAYRTLFREAVQCCILQGVLNSELKKALKRQEQNAKNWVLRVLLLSAETVLSEVRQIFLQREFFCVGLPGTIDNDISCTEYTIGYDTAMNTVVEMVDKLRDTTQSHDRCSVVEVMGRGAGYIALNAGIACGATYVITSEIPYDLDKVAKKMLESRKTGKQHFIIVVSEGVGHSDEIARTLQDKTGIEARTTILGHVQRGGAPTVRDRVVASQMAYYAVELLSQGIGNRVVGMQKTAKLLTLTFRKHYR